MPAGSEAEAHARELNEKIAGLEAALAHEQARTSETVVVGAVRERLPRRRKSSTFAFRVADCEGYVTVGEYEDGRPGEVFMKVSKQGSTLAGIMDAFSISVSLGLQHGVPLATYVRKYTNMRFEPAGITDDPDLRIATSLVDYIFRRLAVDYLPAGRARRARRAVHLRADAADPARCGGDGHAVVGSGRGRVRRPGDRHDPGREWRWPAAGQRRSAVRCVGVAGAGGEARGPPGSGDAAGRPGVVRPADGPGRATGRPLLLPVRQRHAAGRVVLRVRELRHHQRLLVI